MSHKELLNESFPCGKIVLLDVQEETKINTSNKELCNTRSFATFFPCVERAKPHRRKFNYAFYLQGYPHTVNQCQRGKLVIFPWLESAAASYWGETNEFSLLTLILRGISNRDN
jgi:hypothetical protein